ncbi:MAG: dipeptide epimerase [Thermoplasmata archaeon]
MKAALRFCQLRLPRKRFEISTGVRTIADVFIVESEAGNLTGLGSGSPAESMNDNPLKCRNVLKEECERKIDLQDYFDDRNAFVVREKSPSAAAAIDIAIWDLFSKEYGVGLSSIMGISGNEIATGATVDIKAPNEAAENAMKLVQEGFKRIKIKVGTSPASDVERVKAVREAVGDKVELFADANGGFDIQSAIEFWKKVEDFNLSIFEQPVPTDRLPDMARLRKEYGIPVSADESVRDEMTLEEAITIEAVDMVNLKLMKCGGLTPAIEMIRLAREAGIDVMVGCMGDIGISIAAAAHLSIGKGIELTELDSYLNIEQICSGPGIKNGILRLGSAPGLGVDLIDGWDKWVVR